MPMCAAGGTEAAGSVIRAIELPSAVAVRDADPGRMRLGASVVDGVLIVGIALGSVAEVAADGKNELTCRVSDGSLFALPAADATG